MASKLSDKNKRHDVFHRRARNEGFRARSVYKLIELDERFHLFTHGCAVLDLGCRPGSWLEYAHQKSGGDGYYRGIDRLEMPPLAFATTILGDLQEMSFEEIGGGRLYDVVLSDMAPDTSGIRALDQDRSENLFERALEIAIALGKPAGHFVGKLFMGGDFQRIVKSCRDHFDEVRTVKPDGSRKESIEQYVVCLRKKARAT